MHSVEGHIQTLQDAIESARESQQDDTKSSAGDKYETSREMMTQEIEKHSMQLSEAMQQKQKLEQVPTHHHHDEIESGNVVFTNHGNFYLAISAGVLKYNDMIFQTISISSPVGKMLVGKKAGNKFTFNAKEYEIEKVI